MTCISPTAPALDTAQRVAMRQMDVAVGRAVYTPLLTPGGGFRSDLTILRLADDRFRVVTGGLHGMVDLKGSAKKPKIGDVVRIIPNHCCVVTNMMDEVYGVRGDTVEVKWPVAARGKVR